MFVFFTVPVITSNFFIINFILDTKDQWARDDPAFLVLLSFWLLGKKTKTYFVSVIIFTKKLIVQICLLISVYCRK